MPPSPALRCSPGRELRSESHKRGRSLEGGILFKEKDDDLALFNEVQSKERDNFLLQSNDDFEDLFSTKLRYFSDYKLGISIPARGESSDLLNAEGEKNDYDWLLTPPDTPLFPSLDDEAPPVNHAQRGRPRSQPIAISRSSTMERSHRSSRGSASPNRLSPSPRSSHSTYQSRGRPSSAPHSSPPPSLRHSTPTRRPSPPPSKPSMPALRSSTPTPRRLSTGSSSHAVVPSKVRGNSPVKTGRGNSASPKIKAWQANIPGFPSEAPPNLRTSLADRPASYVRGSSPASRNGSKSGRQSMSPTASRSVSSSYSHDRDRFSSHSKASVASSGDDDLDSLQSIPMSSIDHSAPRSISTFPINRGLSSSKKPTRVITSSSAPKRSFDMAIRQMDQRKGPQNMFRPLLSSVPTSTFYASKSGATHRSIVSINSSVTTSSNASSDPGISGTHDTEDSEQNQEDVTSGHKTAYLDLQEEVFSFDKADSIDDKSGVNDHEQLPDVPHDEVDGSPRLDSPLVSNDNSNLNNAAAEISAMAEVLEARGYFPSTDCLEDIVLCSKCGRRFSAAELIAEEDLKICKECRGRDISSLVTSSLKQATMDENSPGVFSKNLNDGSFDTCSPSMGAAGSLEVTSVGGPGSSHGGKITSEEQNSFSEANRNLLPASSVGQNPVEEGKQVLIGQEVRDQQTISYRITNANTERLQNFSSYSSSKADVSEGAGISLLLSSSSGKGPIVRSRTFTATSITCDDFSYTRESATSTRSSFGHGSVSASSSVDLGSNRQIDTRVQRQSSGRKSDLENYRCEMNSMHQCSGSSLSGTSTHAFQTSGMTTSGHDESFEVSAMIAEKNLVDPTCAATQGHSVTSENREGDNVSTDVESDNNCGVVSELSCCTRNIHPGGTSVASIANFEESDLHENARVLTNNPLSAVNVETSTMHIETHTEREDAMSSACIDGVDVVDAPNNSLLDVISEMEIENDEVVSPDSVFDIGSQNSKSSIDDLQDPFATASCSDMAVEELTNLDHAQSIVEESSIMLEGRGGNQARSLTLEEATDTILFCSSIVHNLAYEAANIAIEKENAAAPLEGFHPVVTIVGKSNNDRRDSRARPVAKRNSKSQKARQRRPETESKPPPPENTTSDEKIDSSTAHIVGAPNKGDSMKPPKLESKCNCTIM